MVKKTKRSGLFKAKSTFLLAAILLALSGGIYADDGDLQWTKTYDFDAANKAIGKQIVPADDGGYIIACEYQGLDNWYKICIIKTDANGDTTWTKLYGWTEETNYEIGSIEQTSDGGYIISGFWLQYVTEELNRGRALLIKTDENGDTLWTREYGRGDDEPFLTYNLKTAHETSDGGYILGGYICKPNFENNIYYYDGLVIRTDAAGDTLWSRIYGEDNDTLAYVCYNALETPDGGFILGGYRQYYIPRVQFDESPYFMKLSADGDSLWAQHYRGTSWTSSMYNFTITSDSGFAYCGAIFDNDTWETVAMIGKTDYKGDELWYHEYRTDPNPDETVVTHELVSIEETSDGYFIAVGIKNYRLYEEVHYRNPLVLKADAEGNLIWLNNYYDQAGSAGLWSVALTDDGGFVAAGGTSQVGGSWQDALIMKLDLATGIEDDFAGLPDKFELAQNYPNPFNMSTVISYELNNDMAVKLDIYDLLGRKIERLVDEKQTAGVHRIRWHANDIASGIYFYRIQAGDYSDSKKMFLIK